MAYAYLVLMIRNGPFYGITQKDNDFRVRRTALHTRRNRWFVEVTRGYLADGTCPRSQREVAFIPLKTTVIIVGKKIDLFYRA